MRARYAPEAGGYARLIAPLLRPAEEALADRLPLKAARVVVDVGAGTGTLLPDLARRAPRALVAGVDLSEPMLGLAARATGLPAAVMDARRLAVRGGCADVAVLAFLLFLFPDPPVPLGEVRRILRPGGSLGVAVWGRKHFPAGRAVDALLDEEGVGPDPLPVDRADELMDSPDRLAGLLHRAGFEAVRAWTRKLDHHSDAERVLAVKTRLGATARRLDGLAPDRRQRLVALARQRLAGLPPEDFEDRSEVVLATAGAPAGGGR